MRGFLLCAAVVALLLLSTFTWRAADARAPLEGTHDGVLRVVLARGYDTLQSTRALLQRRKAAASSSTAAAAAPASAPLQGMLTPGAQPVPAAPPAAAAVALHPPLAPSPAPFASIERTLLSIDFHISPIKDLAHLLKSSFPLVRVEDRSLSGACGRTGTCATPQNLLVLRQGDVDNSMHFGGATRRAFFEAYREQGPGGPLVLGSDAMVCSHPTGMCELAMPFNRSVVLWATTRFEQGRERHRERLAGYITNFRALAALPGSVVLANNMYDVHYTHYFTGIKPRYVPSLCAYPDMRWSWRSAGSSTRTVLVHGYRPHRGGVALGAFLQPLLALSQAGRTGGFTFTELREALGSDYAYSSLASHPAILHLPYQVSIMSLFEHYRAGIPILAPSLPLLTSWHMQTLFVSERTWDTVLYNAPASASVLPRHPQAEQPYDPNDEHSEAAVAWWLQWADFYTLPHIILFDSWEHLAEQLRGLDLAAVSQRMLEHAASMEAEALETWAGVLRGLPRHQDRAAQDAALAGLGFEDRMDRIYGKGKWAEY